MLQRKDIISRLRFCSRTVSTAASVSDTRVSFSVAATKHTYSRACLTRYFFPPTNISGPSVSRNSSTMATVRKIQLSTANPGIFNVELREDSARAASEVLQEDLEKHHMFFNKSGFHNHIVHHILTIYALGATPDEIRAAYDHNKTYQRPVLPTTQSIVESMHDKTQFQQHLGKEENFPNYLAFFQQEIEKKGVAVVLNEYLFSGSECAENMFSRLFGGLLHPLIHIGFGLEFDQPAIVAEGLAQTAVHEDWIGQLYLLPGEKAAGGIGKPGKKSLLQILNEIRTDKRLAESVKWADGNKIRDGVLKRAPEEMIRYAAQVSVSAEQMEDKLAELLNLVATAQAGQA
ncbi:hypothetical protein V6Z88_009217 [Aspergillus fumigatus]